MISFNIIIKKFWKHHCERLGKKPSFFSDDFKELFNWMTKDDPEKRPTIAEVKQSKWFNGEIYPPDTLKDIMKSYISA